MKSRLDVYVRVSSTWTNTAVPIYLSGGNALVSCLQALLVQEEFYSIKQCTVIRLFGVSWLLLLGHSYPIQSEREKKR